MDKFDIGVKIYDSDWLLKYHLSPQEAARILKEWGVSFVLAQSQYLQMPDSAVDSNVPDQKIGQYTKADDRNFREALKKEGIEYWSVVCTFFNPSAIALNPTLRPIGSDGKQMEQVDWYIGIAPSMESYVEEQIALIDTAVSELQPDGVFLSFTRWPGFWELWMPEDQRQNFPEYSFDPHTLARFTHETGIDIPVSTSMDTAAWIEKNACKEWTEWKCGVVHTVIQQVKKSAQEIKPDIKIMLNTIPFQKSDFDNAREKVFGQNIKMLSDVVDVFEVMTYHQILKQPVNWLATAGQDVKQRSVNKTVCTIQAEALYLDGIHEKEKRSPVIDESEFIAAVNSIEAADLDGVVIFIWSDLLDDVFLKDKKCRVEALQAAVARRKMRLE